MKYQRTYNLLKQHGHTASKALEILHDAKRKDRWSLKWIRALRKLDRKSRSYQKHLTYRRQLLENLK